MLLLFLGALFHLLPLWASPDWTSNTPYDLFSIPLPVWALHGITLLTAVLAAAILNGIVVAWELASPVHQLPGLVFVILASAHPEFLVASHKLIAILLLLLMYTQLFRAYKLRIASSLLVNAAFWGALMSLWTWPGWLALPMLFQGMLVLRGLTLREVIQVSLSWLAVYVLAFTWMYWQEQTDLIGPYYYRAMGIWDIPWPWDRSVWVVLGVFMLLIGIIVLQSHVLLRGKVQVARAAVVLLLWTMLWAPLAFLFANELSLDYLLMLVPGLSMGIGLLLGEASPRWSNLYLWLLVFFVLGVQAAYYFL